MPTEQSSLNHRIVFPLNTVTSSFALPNNFNVEKFLEKLSHSEQEKFESGTKNMVFLVTENEKQSLLSICLCFGNTQIEQEVLNLFQTDDQNFKQKFQSMLAEMDKSKQKRNPFFEAFRINAKILGQAYTFIKPHMDSINEKKLIQVFQKLVNSSELLFGVKVRYFGRSRSLKKGNSYHKYKRVQEQIEADQSDSSSYLIIDKSEKELWNVGVIEFEDKMISTCDQPSFLSPSSELDISAIISKDEKLQQQTGIDLSGEIEKRLKRKEKVPQPQLCTCNLM